MDVVQPPPAANPRRARSRRVLSQRVPAPLRLPVRAGIFLVGSTACVLGLVMLLTPGPGVVGLAAGLGLLASEFAWARGLYLKAKRHALRAKRAAKRKLRERRERRAAAAWERKHGARATQREP